MKKKGTPMVVAEDSQMYRLPPKCIGPHKFQLSRFSITFLEEDVFSPYFPDVVYHKLCRKCGMRE